MTIKRICGPFGSGNNASVVPTVIQTDEDLVLDECGVIICVDADAVVTLPDSAPPGTEVLVIAESGVTATVLGGGTPLLGGSQIVRPGTACRFVVSCNGVFVAECCCPAVTGVTPTGVTPTGPAVLQFHGLDDGDGTLDLVTGNETFTEVGTASVLGPLSSTGSETDVITSGTLGVDAEGLREQGASVVTTSDGSTLILSAPGTFGTFKEVSATVTVYEGQLDIVGGTGRFAGATGFWRDRGRATVTSIEGGTAFITFSEEFDGVIILPAAPSPNFP